MKLSTALFSPFLSSHFGNPTFSLLPRLPDSEGGREDKAVKLGRRGKYFQRDENQRVCVCVKRKADVRDMALMS